LTAQAVLRERAASPRLRSQDVGALYHVCDSNKRGRFIAAGAAREWVWQGGCDKMELGPVAMDWGPAGP